METRSRLLGWPLSFCVRVLQSGLELGISGKELLLQCTIGQCRQIFRVSKTAVLLHSEGRLGAYMGLINQCQIILFIWGFLLSNLLSYKGPTLCFWTDICEFYSWKVKIIVETDLFWKDSIQPLPPETWLFSFSLPKNKSPFHFELWHLSISDMNYTPSAVPSSSWT